MKKWIKHSFIHSFSFQFQHIHYVTLYVYLNITWSVKVFCWWNRIMKTHLFWNVHDLVHVVTAYKMLVLHILFPFYVNFKYLFFTRIKKVSLLLRCRFVWINIDFSCVRKHFEPFSAKWKFNRKLFNAALNLQLRLNDFIRSCLFLFYGLFYSFF